VALRLLPTVFCPEIFYSEYIQKNDNSIKFCLNLDWPGLPEKQERPSTDVLPNVCYTYFKDLPDFNIQPLNQENNNDNTLS